MHKSGGGRIAVKLKRKKKVQDDPFDWWAQDQVIAALGGRTGGFEIAHAGSLTTPDLVIRERAAYAYLGLEVKKLDRKDSGSDARGLTLDYNSCLPCGTTLIKVDGAATQIPCFYLFCLLDKKQTEIATLILMDGDFINYDFNLHKKSKVSNVSEYRHGPYGEGSVRHRAMYTYPNPLNSKLGFFHLRFVIVMMALDVKRLQLCRQVTDHIEREDVFGNKFIYEVVDFTRKPRSDVAEDDCSTAADIPIHRDVFRACKVRESKERTPAYVEVSPHG